MWLQIVGSPDIVDRRLADALVLGHRPATPVGHSSRFSLQGCIDDGGDFFDRIDGLPAPAWSHVPKAIQSLVGEALPPQNHRVPVHRQLLRNSDIGPAHSGGEHDTAAQRHLLRSAVSPDPLLELLQIYGRKLT